MSQLPPYNYPAGTLIEIDGALHRPEKSPLPGVVMLMNLRTGRYFQYAGDDGNLRLPTDDDIDQLKIAGRLKEKLPSSTIKAREAAAQSDLDAADCAAIDPDSLMRLAVSIAMDEAGIRNGEKATAIWLSNNWDPEFRDRFGEPPHPTTVKRWRLERGTPGNRHPKDMISGAGLGPRGAYLQDVVETIKQRHALAYHVGQGTRRTCYKLAENELEQVNNGTHPEFPQPPVPYKMCHISTFNRACKAMASIAASLAKHGEDYVEAVMRGGGKPLTASRICEKVTIDHTELPGWMVVSPSRSWGTTTVWLSIAVDVHSRVVLAWLITVIPPSYWTVMELLRRALLPKRPPEKLANRYPILKRLCGRPSEIIVDNGPEFRCSSMRDMAGSAGFAVRFCPIYKPRYKAVVERALGTTSRIVLENLPGRTFEIEYHRKAKTDPRECAEITLHGLDALANWAFAEYHITPHDGLDGRTPAQVFERSANAHGIDVMCDFRSAMLEILQVQDNVQITKAGARMFGGLRYYSAIEVAGLIDRNLRFEPRRQSKDNATIHTKVKFDPSNIAKIWAWDRSSKRYVELICQNESYSDGMPLAFHCELVEAAKQEGAGFSTDKERAEYRAIRMAMINQLAPKAAAHEQQALARLYEHPRIRQLTGNLVNLNYEYGSDVGLDQFITNDPASLTSFDAEVLGGPSASRQRGSSGPNRDRRDAGTIPTPAPSAPSRRSRRAQSGRSDAA